MSKNRNESRQVKPLPVAQIQQKTEQETPAITEPRKRVIEEHRHCPVCWSGNGGFGDCYSTQGSTRYYKCVQTTKPDGPGPCGHTWTATVKLQVIRVEHRVVKLDGER